MVYDAKMPATTLATPHTSSSKAAKPKLADSEKITINLGFVDLGHIDLLVPARALRIKRRGRRARRRTCGP